MVGVVESRVEIIRRRQDFLSPTSMRRSLSSANRLRAQGISNKTRCLKNTTFSLHSFSLFQTFNGSSLIFTMVPKLKDKLLKDGEVVAAVGDMCTVSLRISAYNGQFNGKWIAYLHTIVAYGELCLAVEEEVQKLMDR
jgi:hypothetical protein